MLFDLSRRCPHLCQPRCPSPAPPARAVLDSTNADGISALHQVSSRVCATRSTLPPRPGGTPAGPALRRRPRRTLIPLRPTWGSPLPTLSRWS